MSDVSLPETSHALMDAPENGDRFYFTGGSLPGDAPSYVEREADRTLYQALREGEFCYVLTSRQMGKSSLMVRTVHRLEREGVRVAVLDPTRTGSNLTPEQWYYGFLRQVALRFQLRAEMDAWWRQHAGLGPLERLISGLREVVLEKIAGPVVLFIDEIDAVLSLPFTTDEFFAAIRECYNRRVEDSAFCRITFCLLGVASPSDLIHDTRTTPFNIGHRIELNDFTREEAAPLAKGLGLNGTHLLERVLYWTGGHPYLTQSLCKALADARLSVEHLHVADVDRLCEEMFLNSRARSSERNLTYVRDRLLDPRLDTAGLLYLYGQILSGKRVSYEASDKLMGLLRLSGVVKVVQGRLAVRNPIYERVFDRRWLQESLPGAELRRQKEARRRGRIQATLIAAPIILILAALAGVAIFYADKARTAKHQAEEEAQKARKANSGLVDERNRADSEAKRANNEAERANNEARKAKNEARNTQIAYGKLQLAKDDATKNFRTAEHLAQENQMQASQLRATNAQLSKKTISLAAQTSVAQAERFAAVQAANREKIAAHKSEAAERQAKALLYPNLISRAQRAIGEGDLTGAGHLLDQCDPNLRSFTWRFLNNQVRNRSDRHMEAHQRVVADKDPVTVLACSSDGSRIADYSVPYRMSVWDEQNQKWLLDEAHEPVHDAVFINDGRTLLCGGDNHITAWEIDKPQKNFWDDIYPEGLDQQSNHGIFSLAVSPSGKALAYGMAYGIVGIRDLEKPGRPRFLEQALPAQVGCLAYSHNGRLIAGGGQYVDSSEIALGIWDASTTKKVVLGRAPHSSASLGTWVFGVQFLPDDRHLISGMGSGAICVWDISDSKSPLAPLHTLPAHKGAVRATALSADGKILATGGDDGLIKIWDVAGIPRGEPPLVIKTLRGHMGSVLALRFLPGSGTLVSSGQDGQLRFWNQKSLEDGLLAREPHIEEIAASRDGSRYVTCDGFGVVTVRETRTGRQLFHFGKPDYEVMHCALSPDGRTVAISTISKGQRTPALGLYEVDTGQFIGALPCESGALHRLAFSSDGKLLAGGEREPTHNHATYEVHVWEVASRKLVRSYYGHFGWVSSLAFSPDGKVLVSGSNSAGAGDMHFWNLAANGQDRWDPVLKAHAHSITSAAFSSDGKWLATGGSDQTVRLWRYKNGVDKPLELRGHNGEIVSLAFSSDGNTLISSSEDGAIKFWNLQFAEETGFVLDELNLTMEPYQSQTLAGAIFEDRQGTLIVASKSGQVLSWGR